MESGKVIHSDQKIGEEKYIANAIEAAGQIVRAVARRHVWVSSVQKLLLVFQGIFDRFLRIYIRLQNFFRITKFNLSFTICYRPVTG